MIFILAGGKNAGKTSFAHNVVLALQKGGLVIRGFLSVGKPGTGRRKKFDLFDLEDLKSWPLAEPEIRSGYKACGRYYFNPKAVKKGEFIIREAINGNADLVVMDEIGKCELGGMIWDSTFRSALEARSNLMIVVAGKNIDRILSRYMIEEYRHFDIACSTVKHVVACIHNEMGR